VHPRFAAWHAAFWENLDITLGLHSIRRVVAMSHRDCGAAKLAFGERAVAGREAETTSHAEALRAFRAEAARRQPRLAVTLAIMDLNGTIERVG
jgi:carbonic anhydrase